jgi:hypothetical protein
MNCQVANQEKAKLEQVFKDTAELLREINRHSIDLQMQSHLAKYLCVLVSAFLEKSVRAILHDYAKARSAPAVWKYVEDQLQSFYNPKTNRVLELVGRFSPTWKTALEATIEEEVRDALDTIVENKNRIAHGRDSQITFVGIQSYYARAQKVLDLMEQHCR